MNINRIDYKNKRKGPGLSLAIGFFDGVHKGHRLIIEETLKDKNLIPAVLTFSLDMKIGMEKKNSVLLTEDEKEDEIAKLGIQEYFLLPFTDDVKHSSIDEFLDFLSGLNVREVIVGKDFTFANKGEGKAETLRKLESREIRVRIIGLFFEEGDKVSSTRIKKLLEEGKIEEANELLGYSYYVQGEVIHGLANGRKIGFPTANIIVDKNLVHLPESVYKTETLMEGHTFKSMTSIGRHPTIDELDESIIETNIIGFRGDIYGRRIKVVFKKFIRDQVKFQGLEELKIQLKKDQEDCVR